MTVIDLSDTIKAKSDQLNASEIAGEMTIKVTGAKKVSSEQPVVINYEGDGGKPWKPCLSMRRVIAHLWGERVDMTGRMITLVCDPTVTWGGDEVGGIRIKAMSHIEGKKTIPLRASKHKVKKYTVERIEVEQTEAPDADAILSSAQAAAENGIEAYKKYFTGLNAEEKKTLSDQHEELKKKAQEADNDGHDVQAWE